MVLWQKGDILAAKHLLFKFVLIHCHLGGLIDPFNPAQLDLGMLECSCSLLFLLVRIHKVLLATPPTLTMAPKFATRTRKRQWISKQKFMDTWFENAMTPENKERTWNTLVAGTQTQQPDTLRVNKSGEAELLLNTFESDVGKDAAAMKIPVTPPGGPQPPTPDSILSFHRGIHLWTVQLMALR